MSWRNAKRKYQIWVLTFVSEEITGISLSKLYNTIDATNLCGDLSDGDQGANRRRLTQMKADEKYSTQTSKMQALCASNAPLDLMLI